MGNLKVNESGHQQRDSLVVTYFEPVVVDDDDEEENKEESKVMVALNADGFTYNAESGKYCISLSNVRVIKSDLYGNTVTIEIDEKGVNKEKSDEVENSEEDENGGDL